MNKNDLAVVRKLKKQNKKIAFISGKFNIIHPGHIRIIKFAKEIADILILAVSGDNHSGVSIKKELRILAIKEIKQVDLITEYEKSPIDLIKIIKPDFVIKGKEFRNQKNEEEKVVKKINSQIVFASGEVNFSSEYLIDIQSKGISNKIQDHEGYLKRHGSSLLELKEKLSRLKKNKVLIIGESIIDNYMFCNTVNLSHGDHSIVVQPFNEKNYLGGAGIVSCHAKKLNQDVSFLSIVGNDNKKNYVKKILNKNKISHFLFEDPTRPTIFKKRYRVNDKVLLNVNTLRSHVIDKEISKKIFRFVTKKFKDIDLLVFSDFNYGLLTRELIDSLTNFFKNKKCLIVADSQSSSQIGDISKYKYADLITPTEREIRIALKDNNNSLSILSNEIRKKCKTKHILITLGSNGMIINSFNKNKKIYQTDTLPSFNNSPIDVSGAGDCLLSISSICLSSGFNIWESAFLGSVGSAIQISKLGNNPIELNEILENL